MYTTGVLPFKRMCSYFRADSKKNRKINTKYKFFIHNKCMALYDWKLTPHYNAHNRIYNILSKVDEQPASKLYDMELTRKLIKKTKKTDEQTTVKKS